MATNGDPACPVCGRYLVHTTDHFGHHVCIPRPSTLSFNGIIENALYVHEPETVTLPKETVEAVRDALTNSISSMCEGFCKDYPTDEYVGPNDHFDCAVCSLRPALALLNKGVNENGTKK